MADTPFSSGSSNSAFYTQRPETSLGHPTTHDGAPAGPFFSESELPVHGTFDKPYREGFSPSPSGPGLPPAGSTEGTSKPPSGARR